MLEPASRSAISGTNSSTSAVEAGGDPLASAGSARLATGVTKTLTTVGGYSVTENAMLGYHLASISADCFGTIALGEHKTCLLTNDDNSTS